jgi:hypothetical protein
VDRIFYTAEIIAINLVCYTSKRSWFEAFENLQLDVLTMLVNCQPGLHSALFRLLKWIRLYLGLVDAVAIWPNWALSLLVGIRRIWYLIN